MFVLSHLRGFRPWRMRLRLENFIGEQLRLRLHGTQANFVW
jgi:hypothetical protein